jgi:hypothetical protein
MAKYWWKCPKCGTKNYTVNPDEPRIIILVQGWDYCIKCGTPRNDTEVQVSERRMKW